MLPSHWIGENSHQRNEDSVLARLISFEKMGARRSGVDPSPQMEGGGRRLCEITGQVGGAVGVYPDMGINPRGYDICVCSSRCLSCLWSDNVDVGPMLKHI